MRYIYNSKPLYHSVEGLQHLEPASKPVNDPHKYGLPKLKKYPMPDARHVKSAIKFFNYVDPANEKELADAILARIREYNIGPLNIGPSNRFKKYYKPRADNEITVIKHSAGPWENHNYLDKVKIGDTWRYIYDQGQQVGTKLNQVAQTQQPSMETVNKAQEAAHNKAVKIQTNLKSALDKTVSELTGINNSSIHSKNHGVVTKKDNTKEQPAETEAKTDTEKKSGKSGGKGSSKKKSSGSYSNPMKGVNPGHASGGSKSSSGSSGGSSSSSTETEKAAAKKAKIDSKLKKAQEDKKREAEEARRKQKEEFDKRREANMKKAAAEEEVSKRRNSTDSTTVDNSALESIIEMLDDSNKEKVKKLLETKSPSKIQEYLDYTKDKMSSDKKNYNNWKSENEHAEGMRDTARTTVNNKTLDRILEMLDESKKKQAQRILDGKNKLDDLLDELRKRK